MKLSSITSWLLPAAIGFGLTATGCSRHDSAAGSKLAGEATFDAVPANQDTIESQLKRFKGQTKFLTPAQRYWGRGMNRADARAEAAPAEGGARAVQESDIFKIGKPGTKLLYLLNNYRGLQVVSYAQGDDQPELLGRVEATGNYPDAMYFDQAHDRLIVLENNYQSDENDYYDYSDVQSRLVTYDVSNTSAPKIASIVNLKGQLSESRMVGNVLYVATSVRPSYSQRQANQNGQGFVYSFGLDTAEVAQIDNIALAAPISYGENMNVIEVKDGNQFKYFLIAVLSKDGWGFWDRQSLVQVVDISSAAGKINSVMVVNAKGAVRERSQTSIKNNSLIVASNYQSTVDSNIQRVAVESFAFPTATSETIDATEAQFRRLFIDREVAKKEQALIAAGVSGDALEDQVVAFREVQAADASTGLKGRFVNQTSDDGAVALVKPLADSTSTVGNTQGLSASLQDVRFNGDSLYVFWVPANNVDPLDIFDISKPDAIKHVGHLEFDGWIQHAQPVTYAGKDYILGLGWVIPSDDNEHQRRYPQAMLFEVKRFASGAVRADVVAQKNLGTSSTWANFNASDKEIETRFVTDSTGVIMFEFSSWDQNSYVQGGKLIGFDLSKADSDPDQVFAEGGVLSGSDSWLRRIFTNTEINRVNTFADEALATYSVNAGIGAANQIVEASNVLELARNIRGYETLAANGVQIVSNYSWSYDATSKTELRLVEKAKADSEKAQALSLLTLDGNYIDSLKAGDDSLLVLTEDTKRVANADGTGFDYKSMILVTRVTLNDQGLQATGVATWDTESVTTDSRLGYQQKLLKLADGRILAAVGNSVTELTLAADAVASTPLTLANCNVATETYGELKLLSGKLYLTYSESVQDPDRASVTYQRNFAAPVTVDAASLTCQAALNIPGTLLTIVDGHAVTNDTRLIDLIKHSDTDTTDGNDNTYYDVITENALSSVQLDGTTAKLKSLYDPKNVTPGSMQVLNGDTLVFVESTAHTSYWFEDMMGRGDFFRGFPGRSSSTENRLAILTFDSDFDFTKQAYVLDLPLNVNAALQAIFPSPTAGEGYLAVIGQGQRLTVFSFDGVNRPSPKKLAKVGADFTVGEAQDSVQVNSFWYWYEGGIHLTAADRTLEVPQGMFGVTQLVIGN